MPVHSVFILKYNIIRQCMYLFEMFLRSLGIQYSLHKQLLFFPSVLFILLIPHFFFFFFFFCSIISP